MNTDIATACVCYGLYNDIDIVGFCAVLHQPHGKVKNIKRISRLVILPDYQGIGLGTKFLTEVGKIYKKQHNRVTIITSAKNMIYALNKSEDWKCVRYNVIPVQKCKKSKLDYLRKTMRTNCKTATFWMKEALNVNGTSEKI